MIKSDLIKTELGEKSVSFLFNDTNLFSATGYKMLKNYDYNDLIKCEKYNYNGQLKLAYFTQNYRPFSAALNTMSERNFITFLTNAFTGILKVQSHGFLDCVNLCISEDTIFVDPGIFSAHFVYLPINQTLYQQSESLYESEIRALFKRTILDNNQFDTPDLRTFAKYLSDSSYDLKHLSNFIKDIHIHDNSIINSADVTTGKISLISVDAPSDIEFVIDKQEYLIGRKSDAVDGCIDYNKAVGRVHCKISRQDGLYYAEDLNSANGTFINDCKLVSGERCELSNGDLIKLGNCEFRVEI